MILKSLTQRFYSIFHSRRQPEPSASFSGVHRISIVERQTCMPLHDKVWVWKEDEVSPSTASKIIALFHQFARTVGVRHRKPRAVVYAPQNYYSSRIILYFY